MIYSIWNEGTAYGNKEYSTGYCHMKHAMFTWWDECEVYLHQQNSIFSARNNHIIQYMKLILTKHVE